MNFNSVLIGSEDSEALIAYYTKLFGTLFVLWLAQCRQHDHANIGCLWRMAQNVQHVKATDLWHHRIKRRSFFSKNLPYCQAR